MLQKQPVPINFIQGLDTKTDPFQIQIGKFAALNNTVFDTLGRLTKRYGNINTTNLPNALQTTLTTLNDNLIATGSNLLAYNEDSNQWLQKGTVQPVSLSVQSMVRNSASQTSPDMALATSGLACLTYIQDSIAYYQISDSRTGQQIVPQTPLPATATQPRAFVLGRYFIITFTATVSATTHLQYIAIPTSNPEVPGAATDISTTVQALDTGYDGYVSNNNLYIAWSVSPTQIDLAFLTSTLIVSAPAVLTGHGATKISVTADESSSTSVIWVSFYDSVATNVYTAAFTQTLIPVLGTTLLYSTVTVSNITSTAIDGVVSVFFQVVVNYTSPQPTVEQDLVNRANIAQDGSGLNVITMLYGVGLASKAFIDITNDTTYLFVQYVSDNQTTYFLVNFDGDIFMKLAYGNGEGYYTQLPSVTSLNSKYYVPYLIKDFLTTVNKTTNPAAPTNAIYTQAGINMAVFSINTSGQHSSEIASCLYLTGGILWEYDGVRTVEEGFHVWPEDISFTSTNTGGNMSSQLYNYVFTYEWTNNQGNIERSAPSIPLVVDLTGAGTSTNEVTLYVPNLRLTYKDADNPVRIVGYRWSVAQQVFYQFTSVTSPVLNDTRADFTTITDTLADSSILGNAILYTTGGVIEDIGAPASVASVLYKNRLFLIDAEDQNLLWFSKQVIENTPVEMSDLFTIYVAPTTGAQQSTGPMTALSAMDDKLIIFKKDASYYLTGIGPDNTGAQNDFSDPIYITSSVGCANPNSIVLMPMGIMFQSDKGIWLLGRDLSTSYIGAPVEKYNSNQVMSASAIPGTNQVRFVLDNNVTLMYDYFVQQWGTFSNIFAISACLYQTKHTYLNSFGKVFQEAPGTFTDGSVPVLLSFTTSWMNVAGLQGYERFYFANLLGTYITPFTLDVQLAYDYNAGATQAISVLPDNYNANWGGEAQWGSGAGWGGNSNVFSARIFPEKQKCQSFQLTINEIYDSSFGVPAGQGLTLSGLNMIIGVKKGWRTQSAAKSFG